MTVVRVRAPASSANLGPGFDCAAVALDLWNELEVRDGEGVTVEGEGADELPQGPEHLGVRAYALVASLEGRSFSFTNRIPVGRGLGSSAAARPSATAAADEPSPRSSGMRLTKRKRFPRGEASVA